MNYEDKRLLEATSKLIDVIGDINKGLFIPSRLDITETLCLIELAKSSPFIKNDLLLESLSHLLIDLLQKYEEEK